MRATPLIMEIVPASNGMVSCSPRNSTAKVAANNGAVPMMGRARLIPRRWTLEKFKNRPKGTVRIPARINHLKVCIERSNTGSQNRISDSVIVTTIPEIKEMIVVVLERRSFRLRRTKTALTAQQSEANSARAIPVIITSSNSRWFSVRQSPL